VKNYTAVNRPPKIIRPAASPLKALSVLIISVPHFIIAMLQLENAPVVIIKSSRGIFKYFLLGAVSGEISARIVGSTSRK
jgi:hypothetical protein